MQRSKCRTRVAGLQPNSLGPLGWAPLNHDSADAACIHVLLDRKADPDKVWQSVQWQIHLRRINLSLEASARISPITVKSGRAPRPYTDTSVSHPPGSDIHFHRLNTRSPASQSGLPTSHWIGLGSVTVMPACSQARISAPTQATVAPAPSLT
jgi:hypothetical protein